MLANYLPVLIFLTVATGLALVLMTLGLVIGRWQAKAKNDAQKLSPYECGFEAFEDSRMKFDVRYGFFQKEDRILTTEDTEGSRIFQG
jgi:NADH-quinone oxidoreductase subunit A